MNPKGSVGAYRPGICNFCLEFRSRVHVLTGRCYLDQGRVEHRSDYRSLRVFDA